VSHVKETHAAGVDVVNATAAMCAWCFLTLEHYLSVTQGVTKRERSISQSDSWSAVTAPSEISAIVQSRAKAPVFVTWMKKTHSEAGFFASNMDLRGCVGSLESVFLNEIPKYALRAAVKDPRFSAITRSEVCSLQCKISILDNFERASHLFDWDIDVHGILIKFTQKGTRYSATFLPGVATEHCMTPEVTIRRLIRKSGWTGSITSSVLEGIQLTRYVSTKASLTFDQYQAYRCH